MIKQISLVGNPNCGKTTLYNKITGANEYVGNRTGVTVETVTRKIKGSDTVLTDLPGIYSLSPYTDEERIAKEYLLSGETHGIINIIDGSHIERNLYLTLQLMRLDIPMVVVVNMSDEVEAKGIKIDYKALSAALGIKFIPISARTGNGIEALLKFIDKWEFSKNKKTKAIIEKIEEYKNQSEIEDEEIKNADSIYKYIEELQKEFVVKGKKQETFSDKIDKIILNRFLAIPIFFLVMLLMFTTTFGVVGTTLNGLMDSFISNFLSAPLEGFLIASNAPLWTLSLIIDGIVAGIGSVLSFIPQILILFLFLSILEDTGYMTRVAFMMDSVLRKIGLSGKSFIPMIMGFGCTTPAIMAARTLENEKDRKLTILLTPFMSCGAKLPIYALFAGVFFQKHQGLITFSMYLLGIIVAVIIGLLLKNTLFRHNDPPFVMELPPYRLPSLKSTIYLMWDKAKGFLIKAGTVIFAMSVVIWLLQNFDFSLRQVADSTESMLGIIGMAIAPIFEPLGFGNWQSSVSLISGLVAKETVVSSLSVLYGSGISEAFTPLSAYSYMVFCLLYVPCVSAFVTIARELKSKWWTIFSFVMQMVVAYVVSFLIYNIKMKYIIVILCGGLVILAFFIIIKTIRNNFKSKGCGGNCSNCSYNSCDK